MVLQKRERQLLDFLEAFGAISTSQAIKLFYGGMQPISSRKKAQHRLKMLYDNKYLKRDRSDLNSEYIYYLKKTPLLYHQLLLVDVYIAIKSFKGQIIEFTPELPMGDIRPDAKIVFDDGMYTHFILVEIHRSNLFDQEKYERFYTTKVWKEYFKAFPKILVVSDKKIVFKESRIPYYQVPSSLDGIKKIIGR